MLARIGGPPVRIGPASRCVWTPRVFREVVPCPNTRAQKIDRPSRKTALRPPPDAEAFEAFVGARKVASHRQVAVSESTRRCAEPDYGSLARRSCGGPCDDADFIVNANATFNPGIEIVPGAGRDTPTT